jgi:hypothetical protein
VLLLLLRTLLYVCEPVAHILRLHNRSTYHTYQASWLTPSYYQYTTLYTCEAQRNTSSHAPTLDRRLAFTDGPLELHNALSSFLHGHTGGSKTGREEGLA